ncbi:hypothetical protein [Mesorhizobium sp.]|uniref:hypothetical protein n=1 Tax=Mesorhizobium sp. TaxID=1871066 RepID=UPI00257E94E7|nr:hypothetical protein [Mesorhizobium sp.]
MNLRKLGLAVFFRGKRSLSRVLRRTNYDDLGVENHCAEQNQDRGRGNNPTNADPPIDRGGGLRTHGATTCGMTPIRSRSRLAALLAFIPSPPEMILLSSVEKFFTRSCRCQSAFTRISVQPASSRRTLIAYQLIAAENPAGIRLHDRVTAIACAGRQPNRRKQEIPHEPKPFGTVRPQA